jgi:HEAT repeat protein
MFLCRALGSFHVTDGVPALLEAATTERDPMESEVRLSALEALATLASNVGAEKLCENPDVMPTLLACSREQDESSAPPPQPESDGTITLYQPQAELRAVAAFALGVIGNDEAVARLKVMLHDPYPNARYNAATGLARRGDEDCVRVLREMLDPDNDASVRDENNDRDRAQKRTTVLMNGVRAALLYAETNPQSELKEIKGALDRLSRSKLDKVVIDRSKVQAAAVEALRLIESQAPGPRS